MKKSTIQYPGVRIQNKGGKPDNTIQESLVRSKNNVDKQLVYVCICLHSEFWILTPGFRISIMTPGFGVSKCSNV